MYVVKNLETNETKQFETLEAIAQWFNYYVDVHGYGVWDKFIELHPSYEIKRINVDKSVVKIVPRDIEDDDDLPF